MSAIFPLQLNETRNISSRSTAGSPTVSIVFSYFPAGNDSVQLADIIYREWFQFSLQCQAYLRYGLERLHVCVFFVLFLSYRVAHPYSSSRADVIWVSGRAGSPLPLWGRCVLVQSTLPVRLFNSGCWQFKSVENVLGKSTHFPQQQRSRGQQVGKKSASKSFHQLNLCRALGRI